MIKNLDLHIHYKQTFKKRTYTYLQLIFMYTYIYIYIYIIQSLVTLQKKRAN